MCIVFVAGFIASNNYHKDNSNTVAIDGAC